MTLNLPRGAHQSSCPVRLDVDRAARDDVRWFAAHRDAVTRRRPASWGERQEMVIAGLSPDEAGRASIRVHRGPLGIAVRGVLVPGARRWAS